jgi:hypothetical protein
VSKLNLENPKPPLWTLIFQLQGWKAPLWSEIQLYYSLFSGHIRQKGRLVPLMCTVFTELSDIVCTDLERKKHL